LPQQPAIVKKITAIIVDDNIVDQQYLESLLALHSNFIELKGCFGNALEAQEFFQHSTADIMFMDIDMPVLNGMDYFKQLQQAPVCIFVTAYSEYAWEGFEAHAFDYILKPVKTQRLADTIARLKEYFEIKQRADLYDAGFEENTIVIKEGTTKHVVPLNDILYIEALKDYSKVVTASKKILTLSKLKHFLDKLPQQQFTRVHRSYAIALNKVQRSDANDIYIADKQIPIGKTFKQTLKFLL
jgi:DNA-binding LytR/AlgR family response regulator